MEKQNFEDWFISFEAALGRFGYFGAIGKKAIEESYYFEGCDPIWSARDFLEEKE